MKYDYSEYFLYNQYNQKSKKFENNIQCTEQVLAGGDTKVLKVIYEDWNVPKEYTDKLKDGFLRFEFNANSNVLFHFIKYKIRNTWEFYQEYPVSYSEVHGFISPDEQTDNQNVTTAFKGAHETRLNIQLTPTKFTSESDNIRFEGFRVQASGIKKGDTANIWTIPLKYRASGAPNAGFAFEIWTELVDKLNIVR